MIIRSASKIYYSATGFMYCLKKTLLIKKSNIFLFLDVCYIFVHGQNIFFCLPKYDFVKNDARNPILRTSINSLLVPINILSVIKLVLIKKPSEKYDIKRR